MCFGGGGSSNPPAPPPPARPPEIRNMQPTPTSPEGNEASGRGSQSSTVQSNRKGRNVLRIPLLRNESGSGVQIPN